MPTVQSSVKERVKPDHPAEADQIRQPQEFPQRCHRQREHQETQSPITREVGDVLDFESRSRQHGPEMRFGVSALMMALVVELAP